MRSLILPSWLFGVVLGLNLRGLQPSVPYARIALATSRNNSSLPIVLRNASNASIIYSLAVFNVTAPVITPEPVITSPPCAFGNISAPWPLQSPQIYEPPTFLKSIPNPPQPPALPPPAPRLSMLPPLEGAVVYTPPSVQPFYRPSTQRAKSSAANPNVQLPNMPVQPPVDLESVDFGQPMLPRGVVEQQGDASVTPVPWLQNFPARFSTLPPPLPAPPPLVERKIMQPVTDILHVRINKSGSLH
eukprot:TRINITY_DN52741_c0_g1_i1.p1 TRINITY_DN52741_c0_g1~~TRINITY_DN52741_c0_g1_i1.p1  ORF type:complete len:245 (-),score=31.65 TRINITY_DN52741_c0_g1_i1:101-835(-)